MIKIYWSSTGEVHALKGIDAAFPAGAVTAVVGPSGSGKSSFLRILGCVDRPTAGIVRIHDRDVSSLSPRKRRTIRRELIGLVSQRPSDNLVPYLSARDHLRTAALIRGGGRRGEAEEILEQLGIAGRAGHRPDELSGGEQQRLAFAAAVIGDPALVLADEPTAELDSESGRRLMDLVRGLARRGLSFVVATHDPIVTGAADRILHLRHGALEAETKEARELSVIDPSGRIQLPPEALKLFPDHRAQIQLEDGEVRITPP